jgi:SP family general alpha glucoside:H+ symporter-like MFS transporter
MASEKVVPTEKELKGFDLESPDVVSLIHRAQESDAADRKLTVRQALVKYKKAVFWAMFLSTSLVMEGYDAVIVSTNYSFAYLDCTWLTGRENVDHVVLRTDAVSEPIRSL